jgi:hypothetical protein
MQLFITLLENIEKSRTSAGRWRPYRLIGVYYVLFDLHYTIY